MTTPEQEVGQSISLNFDRPDKRQASRSGIVKVLMTIEAPDGSICRLFDRGYVSPDTQCEAIRTFVEQHIGRNGHNSNNSDNGNGVAHWVSHGSPTPDPAPSPTKDIA